MSDEMYVLIISLSIFLNAYLIFKLHSITNKNDGEIVVSTDPDTGTRIFSLELDRTPEEIENMKYVSFVVTSVNGS